MKYDKQFIMEIKRTIESAASERGVPVKQVIQEAKEFVEQVEKRREDEVKRWLEAENVEIP